MSLLLKRSRPHRFQTLFQCPRFSTQPLVEDDLELIHPHHHDNEPNLHLHRKRHVEQPRAKIGRLVLVRHGQSEWNVTDPTRNLTARFVSEVASYTFMLHILNDFMLIILFTARI